MKMSSNLFDVTLAALTLITAITIAIVVVLFVLQGTIGRPERVCYTPTRDGIPIGNGGEICTIIRVL